MTYQEKKQGEYYDTLNNKFWNAEREDQRYIKQKLAMRLYHQLKHFGMTLKQAWAAVIDYFTPVAAEYTCATPLNLSNYYGKGLYNGD